jgi:hypothetical protein
VIGKLRPTEDIRNLFEKKTYGIKRDRLDSQRGSSQGSITEPTVQDKRKLEAFKKKRKKLFEFEGRYDDIPDENNVNALFNKLNGIKTKGGRSLLADRRANLMA